MPVKTELTDRQRAILEYIVGKVEPVSNVTFREIGERFGIRSPNGVLCHMKALRKKGYISTDPAKKGIRVLRKPESPEPAPL